MFRAAVRTDAAVCHGGAKGESCSVLSWPAVLLIQGSLRTGSCSLGGSVWESGARRAGTGAETQRDLSWTVKEILECLNGTGRR